jgi:hypothetical protein
MPQAVLTIASLCQQMRVYYYSMQDFLEADLGISEAVAQSLPGPVITPTLKLLHGWEQQPEVGSIEFKSRMVNASGHQNVEPDSLPFLPRR